MAAGAHAWLRFGTTAVRVRTTVQLVLTCSVCVHHSPMPLTDRRAVILFDVGLPVSSVLGQYAIVWMGWQSAVITYSSKASKANTFIPSITDPQTVR